MKTDITRRIAPMLLLATALAACSDDASTRPVDATAVSEATDDGTNGTDPAVTDTAVTGSDPTSTDGADPTVGDTSVATDTGDTASTTSAAEVPGATTTTRPTTTTAASATPAPTTTKAPTTTVKVVVTTTPTTTPPPPPTPQNRVWSATYGAAPKSFKANVGDFISLTVNSVEDQEFHVHAPYDIILSGTHVVFEFTADQKGTNIVVESHTHPGVVVCYITIT